MNAGWIVAHVERGMLVRVARTGVVGRVRAVDTEWAELHPYKGPLVTLDVRAERTCYSWCELEPVVVAKRAGNAGESGEA